MLLLLSCFTISTATNENKTIYVDDDAEPSWYDATHVQTIQEGIDNAENDYLIYIHNGTYQPSDNIHVYKEVTIKGENKESVIVTHDAGSEELSIRAKNVVISDITFINFIISNQIQYDNLILKNNNFLINNDEGYWNSALMHIAGNNNEISNNKISFIGLEDSKKNPSMGIFIQCYESVIDNNIIEGKPSGFTALEILDRSYWTYEELKGCNIIEGNTFSNNGCGIHLIPTVNPNYWSLISRNNFLNNGVQATFCIQAPSIVDIIRNHIKRMIAQSDNADSTTLLSGFFGGYWDGNYWDDYDATGIKAISGSIQTELLFNQFFLYSIPWKSFDFHPATEPYGNAED